MELEQFKYIIEVRDKIAQERKKRGLEEVAEATKAKKKIIGLSCGKKNGNCETYLKAAAMGAAAISSLSHQWVLAWRIAHHIDTHN